MKTPPINTIKMAIQAIKKEVQLHNCSSNSFYCRLNICTVFLIAENNLYPNSFVAPRFPLETFNDMIVACFVASFEVLIDKILWYKKTL